MAALWGLGERRDTGGQSVNSRANTSGATAVRPIAPPETAAWPGALSQPAGESALQLREADGFWQEVAHSGLEAGGAVALHRVSGEGHDGQRASIQALAAAAGYL